VNQRVYDRSRDRLLALQELQDEANDLNFSKDGMVANWEYFDEQY